MTTTITIQAESTEIHTCDYTLVNVTVKGMDLSQLIGELNPQEKREIVDELWETFIEMYNEIEADNE